MFDTKASDAVMTFMAQEQAKHVANGWDGKARVYIDEILGVLRAHKEGAVRADVTRVTNPLVAGGRLMRGQDSALSFFFTLGSEAPASLIKVDPESRADRTQQPSPAKPRHVLDVPPAEDVREPALAKPAPRPSVKQAAEKAPHDEPIVITPRFRILRSDIQVRSDLTPTSIGNRAGDCAWDPLFDLAPDAGGLLFPAKAIGAVAKVAARKNQQLKAEGKPNGWKVRKFSDSQACLLKM